MCVCVCVRVRVRVCVCVCCFIFTNSGAGLYRSVPVVLSGIQKLQYYGGSRETSLALQAANRDLNNVTIGVRPDVPRVVVVVTAGNSDIPARTVAQVQLLRQAGTYIYALGE